MQKTKMSRSKKRSGSKAAFPVRLHDMMEFVEANGLESIISWELGGRGFMIHDPDKLVEILSLFFGQTKVTSFRRQLNMWHFERIAHGPSKGTFLHPYFVRGNRELCGLMSRQIGYTPRRSPSPSNQESNKKEECELGKIKSEIGSKQESNSIQQSKLGFGIIGNSRQHQDKCSSLVSAISTNNSILSSMAATPMPTGRSNERTTTENMNKLFNTESYVSYPPLPTTAMSSQQQEQGVDGLSIEELLEPSPIAPNASARLESFARMAAGIEVDSNIYKSKPSSATTATNNSVDGVLPQIQSAGIPMFFQRQQQHLARRGNETLPFPFEPNDLLDLFEGKSFFPVDDKKQK